MAHEILSQTAEFLRVFRQNFADFGISRWLLLFSNLNPSFWQNCQSSYIDWLLQQSAKLCCNTKEMFPPLMKC